MGAFGQWTAQDGVRSAINVRMSFKDDPVLKEAALG